MYVEPGRFQSIRDPAISLALPPAQEQEFADKELRTALIDVLSKLTPREAVVVSARFGLYGEEETYSDIGARLGVSAERVRQIEAHAFRKMRHPSRSRRLAVWDA